MLALGQSGFFSSSSDIKAAFLKYCKPDPKAAPCASKEAISDLFLCIYQLMGVQCRHLKKTKEKKKSKLTGQDGPFSAEEVTQPERKIRPTNQT